MSFSLSFCVCVCVLMFMRAKNLQNDLNFQCLNTFIEIIKGVDYCKTDINKYLVYVLTCLNLYAL